MTFPMLSLSSSCVSLFKWRRQAWRASLPHHAHHNCFTPAKSRIQEHGMCVSMYVHLVSTEFSLIVCRRSEKDLGPGWVEFLKVGATGLCNSSSMPDVFTVQGMLRRPAHPEGPKARSCTRA